MSVFIEQQAVESDEESETGREPRPKKSKRTVQSDSDEEDEDDDEETRRVMEGFVVEEVPEEEEQQDSDKESSSDSNSDIDDEDKQLIEDNTGISVRSTANRARIEDSDDEDEDEEARAKRRIANDIFNQGSDGEGDEMPPPRALPPPRPGRDSDESGSDSEPDAPFIVDGENRPIRPTKKNRHLAGATMSNAQLEEAREIFGVDFDYADFLGGEDDADDFGDEEEERPEGEELDEEDEAYRRRRRKAKQSLLGQLEPAELAEGFLGDADKRIQLEDLPERFQLRRVPVNPQIKGDELAAEAKWIFHYAFSPQAISSQETTRLFNLVDRGDEVRLRDRETGELERDAKFVQYKKTDVLDKMESALKYIRVDNFEVPFIQAYRKEYMEPELELGDLWRIYDWDERWAAHFSRRQHVGRLFERMHSWQRAVIGDSEVPEGIRLINDEDYQAVRDADTQEELADVSLYFDLHHGPNVPRMEEWERTLAAERGEEVSEPLKRPVRKDPYHICLAAGLGAFAEKFGLRPAHLAENFKEGYQKHEVESYGADPEETAAQFVTDQFDEPDKVLLGAKFMVAKELSREPYLRKHVRAMFCKRAMLSTKVTKKGRKEIDENHPVYKQKYLKNKPVRYIGASQEQPGVDITEAQRAYDRWEFLRLVEAEDAKLLQLILHADFGPGAAKEREDLATELQESGYYRKDAYSDAAKAWNQLRDETLEMAVNEMLLPQLAKELRARLLNEAKDAVLEQSGDKMREWLRWAPWAPPISEEMEEEEAMEALAGARVVALAYSTNRDEAAFAAALDPQGALVDHLRLCHITKPRRSRNEQLGRLKQQDLEAFKAFVQRRKPHIVCLASESIDCLDLKRDLEDVLREIENETRGRRRITVEVVDAELAHVFAASKRASAEFPELPARLREAIAVGRRFQDPLAELAQLWSSEEEGLCLAYHPMQAMLSKESLAWAVQKELINRVNQVGVDINRCLSQPHRSGLLQFCCGLGPRKAAAILKILRANEFLENRTRLVTLCKMGNKVFMNCAGFIRIDVSRFSEEQHNIFIELLDGTRIHPETYEWARKMAIDALEMEDADESGQGAAIEEIFRTPEKLRELDLDAFADELERQSYGNKLLTLYDIQHELRNRYKDPRPIMMLQSEMASMREEDMMEEERARDFWNDYFNLVSKETPATFNTGKLVLGRVLRVAYKRVLKGQRDEAQPMRDDQRDGLWKCSICSKGGFGEIAEVWQHLDDACPGQATGVRVRLENGLVGFLPTSLISDNPVANPEERVKPHQPIHCRVTEIRPRDFNIRLTSRTTDLMDVHGTYRPPKDHWYDHKEEEADQREEERAKALAQRSAYVKRVIAHSNFRNVSFKEAEKILERMEQGDCIIRPSSKGADHLTVSWKVADGVFAHIDVREEGKEKPFSLGSQLWIGDEEFEDLDEIVARFVQPMAAQARDLLAYKYFAREERREDLERRLKEEKARQPSRIPYLISVSKALPGKFLLSYLPSSRCRHEYMTVLPEGLKYRKQTFSTLAYLLRWFKEHYREPPPARSPGQTTPGDQSSFAGPGVLDGGSVWGRVPGTPGTGNFPAFAAPPPQPPNLGYSHSGGHRSARHRSDWSDAGSSRRSHRPVNPQDMPDNKDWRHQHR